MKNYTVREECQNINVNEFRKRYPKNFLGDYSTVSEEVYDTLEEALKAYSNLDDSRVETSSFYHSGFGLISKCILENELDEYDDIIEAEEIKCNVLSDEDLENDYLLLSGNWTYKLEIETDEFKTKNFETLEELKEFARVFAGLKYTLEYENDEEIGIVDELIGDSFEE